MMRADVMGENIARASVVSEKEYHSHFKSMIFMLNGLLESELLKRKLKKTSALPDNLKNSVDIALTRHIKENLPIFSDVFSQYVMIAEDSGNHVDIEINVVLSGSSYDIRKCLVHINRESHDFIWELADLWIGAIIRSWGGEAHKALYSFYKDEEKKYGKYVEKIIERFSIEVLKEIVPYKRYVITIRLPAISFADIEIHKPKKDEENLDFLT